MTVFKGKQIRQLAQLTPNSNTLLLGENGSTTGSILAQDFIDLAADSAGLSSKQDALVSGTNIKTVNGNSLLGSGDIDLESSKQDALVSGTNIKTINGSSLLGSGDINITPSTLTLSDTGNYFGSTKDIETVLQELGKTFTSQAYAVAVSDETSALTTGTAKITFRMPYGMTLSEVRGSLSTAQTSGAVVQFNVKKNGSTIFSTTPSFDNSEKTTKTATTPAVLSSTTIADDDEITIDILQIGDGTAKGLKVTFIGKIV